MDILIHFNYYQGDHKLAQRLIQNVYLIYPKANLLAISDGFCLPLDCPTIITEESLKQTDIVAFIHRNSQLLINYSKAKWFLQLDPDSYLYQPIDWPKLTHNWYGKIINHKSGLKSTWGCAELKSRQIISELQVADMKPMSYEKGLSRDLTMATYLYPKYCPQPLSNMSLHLRYKKPTKCYSVVHPVPLGYEKVN